MHPTKLNTSFELLNSLFFDIDLAIFNAALYNLSFVFNSFFTSFSFVIKLYWKHKASTIPFVTSSILNPLSFITLFNSCTPSLFWKYLSLSASLFDVSILNTLLFK